MSTVIEIQHLLVLMLENRSFDHMLGYLEYPPEAGFEGVRGREETMVNPLPAGGQGVIPGPNAPFSLAVGPGHSHNDVLEQLQGTTDRARPYHLTNDGFAVNYDRHSPGQGSLALQCFTPDKVPVLSTLAQEFAVCDHWFCSVPGATWPNRNFVLSGTSDGEVNIQVRLYDNPTIFEQLSAGQRDWAVYYGGFPPQALAFPRPWSPFGLHWLQRYKPIDQLYRAIRHDHLPHYAFIEPDMIGKLTDSQHPGMGGEMDFRAGEHLIWRLYTALRQNPDVFNKTLLVVTYDEHGGFFDHVPPPVDDRWAVDQVYEEPATGYRFPFDLLGLRVPAVLISPWIDRLTIDTTVYDHSSVPATVGKLFDLNVAPLGKRVQAANTFEGTLRRTSPRTDLPELAEPVVDNSVRHMIQESDLRPSLTAIATDLLWTELRPRPVQPSPFDVAPPPPVPGLSITPEEAERAVLDDVLPELSPEAQQALTAVSPPGAGASPSEADALPVIQTAVGTLKGFAERLANLGLVDDLSRYADRVVRLFFDSHKVILRTVTGTSLEQPDQARLGQALDELLAQPDPAARLWLADYQDRWLTIQANGRVTFLDRDADEELALPSVTRARALELLALLQAGDIRALRHAFS